MFPKGTRLHLDNGMGGKATNLCCRGARSHIQLHAQTINIEGGRNPIHHVLPDMANECNRLPRSASSWYIHSCGWRARLGERPGKHL